MKYLYENSVIDFINIETVIVSWPDPDHRLTDKRNICNSKIQTGDWKGMNVILVS